MLFFALAAAALGLVFRLRTLSLGENKSQEVLSGQYMRRNTAAERTGFVYSRDGKLLSHSICGAAAIVNPSSTGEKNDAIAFLSENSSLTFDGIFEKYRYGEPFVVSLDEIPSEKPPKGIYVYPIYGKADNALCRHLLGFFNADGDGVDGIYAKIGSVTSDFSGSVSYVYAADARGGTLGSLTVEDFGYSDDSGIILTIDCEIQRAVDEICNEKMQMGAVLVSDISTGELLAVASRPLYDSENASESLDSENGEFINRALSAYTPGSVFKTFVAAAALEKDTALADFEYECTGGCDVSGQLFGCHKKDGHGVQNLKTAYANSCNAYFINLADEIGFEYICEMCSRLGLGTENPIDGLYVRPASVPDVSVKYPDAYRANISFGQGDLLISPADMHRAYSACVSGYLCDLSVIKGFRTGGNDDIFPLKSRKRVISEYTSKKICEMMSECVENGTGGKAKSELVNVGGKTATAQSGQYKNGEEILHRWFSGVFPIENPKYAVTVLCDGNGENASPAEIFSDCVGAVLQEK